MGKNQDEWLRLFIIPGMGHCRGGPGPNEFDGLGVLERWRESGIAPDQIVGSNVAAGLTRSLCAYPQVAQYKGSGTVNGVTGFDFTLTAYDGDIGGSGQTGADRFRITITNHTTGAVVFDNRNGASMAIDSANPQNIQGGSIVIHKA